MELIKNTHFDFIGNRIYTYVISGSLILIGLAALILRGGPRYGIDFTGGTAVEIKFSQNMSPGDLRTSMGKVNLAGSEIKQVGPVEDNDFIIRVQQMEESTNVANIIQQELTKDFPANPFDVRSVTDIGPKMGAEMRRNAVMAVLLGMLGILIYVSWRFEFKFAVGGVIALFHDVTITLGLFAILNLEFDLTVLAAFLTLVGFSINDTIVVFDRIRENIKTMRRENLGTIMNISINQTLSRTIITTFTAWIGCVVLFFLGGPVVHNFAFALAFGFIIGTYSSIWVASTIVFDWHKWDEKKKGAKAKPLLRSMR
jgi:preprotein translocase subunit SecF